jgi:hypothetical protein
MIIFLIMVLKSEQRSRRSPEVGPNVGAKISKKSKAASKSIENLDLSTAIFSNK